MKGIKRSGDAIGLHTHSWRWNESLSKWTVDLANQDWINSCLRMGFESFRESLNKRCLYFRFGDHWMNNATLRLIEKLGARFDLTLEPGQTGGHIAEPFTGDFLDYSQVPQRPYRPSRTDFRKPGEYLKRRLWMIPLSAGTADWPATSADVEPRESSKNINPQEGSPLPRDSRSKPHNPNGIYEGYLDRTDGEFISGWTYDKSRPEMPIEVEIYDGDHPLTTAIAATFRQDLLAAGKGNGKHSFNVPVPTWLKDGKPHSIQVKVAGTDSYLKNSPKELSGCEANGAEYLTLNLAFNPWILCRIINTLLTSSDSPYLALVVRSDVSLHADQKSHLDQTVNYILDHPLIEQLVFETPAEMIRRIR